MIRERSPPLLWHGEPFFFRAFFEALGKASFDLQVLDEEREEAAASKRGQLKSYVCQFATGSKLTR